MAKAETENKEQTVNIAGGIQASPSAQYAQSSSIHKLQKEEAAQTSVCECLAASTNAKLSVEWNVNWRREGVGLQPKAQQVKPPSKPSKGPEIRSPITHINAK